MPQATQVRNKETQLVANRVPARPFRQAFFAALLGFALVNIIAAYTVPQSFHKVAELKEQARLEQDRGEKSRHTWAWWLARLYEEQPKSPDIVVFGSSLLGSAHASIDATHESKLIDVLTHRRMSYFENEVSRRLGKQVSVFSLGSPGEMISDAYVISKALIHTKQKPRLVIATIAPRDFIDATLSMPAATDHYKFYSKFLDLTSYRAQAYPEFFARLGAEIDRLPLKRLSTSFSRYAESNENELARSETFRIAPGNSLVPANAVPPKVDNSKEYVERFRTPFSATYNSEISFFKSWIKELREAGIEVMVVCMPTTEQNKALLPRAFWTRFREDISSICRVRQVKWLDFSDCTLFQDGTDYLDTVHLNAYGAVRLFPAIADHIILDDRARKVLEQNYQARKP